MRIMDALASVAGRISLGIAMAGSVGAGFWYGHTGDIDPVRLLAVITTSGAWLAAEIVSGRKPSEHDLALFKRIVENLPAGTMDFIRDQDFHHSFHSGHQDGLFELAGWDGSRNQFLDSTLRKRWSAVQEQIKKLTAELLHCGPIGAGPLFTAHPEIGDRDNPAPWVQDRIDALNRESTRPAK